MPAPRAREVALRSVVLFAVVLVVGGVYLFGGRRLDKEQVLDFYRTQEAAMLALDDERICSLLADDFEQRSRVRGGRVDVPPRRARLTTASPWPSSSACSGSWPGACRGGSPTVSAWRA